MRLWICATNSLASVVITTNVRIHSPEVGSFQFPQRPPMPTSRKPADGSVHMWMAPAGKGYVAS